MKKQILKISTAIFTLIVGMSNLAANECGNSGIYIGGFGGINFFEDTTGNVTEVNITDSFESEYHKTKLEMNPGFAGGLSLGYKFENRLRLEGELAYRKNTLNKVHALGLIIDSSDIKFSVECYTAMANIVYDFQPICGFTPYLGAGCGYGYSRGTFKAVHEVFEVDFNTHGFVYQGIAGVSYSIGCKTDLALEYRFARLNTNEHAITLALRQYF